MRIGIIGTGYIGGTLARLLVGRGHEVVLANSRGPGTLTEMIADLGPNASAGTVEDVAHTGDLVILAIPFNRYHELPAQPFRNRIVVDAGNYDLGRDGRYPRLDSREITSGELLAELLPDAKVVKAFNTIWYRRLRDEGRPGDPLSKRLAIPMAGDDPAAKSLVADLIDELGFAPVDTGSLADSRKQEYGTPVFNKPVGAAEAQALLDLVR